MKKFFPIICIVVLSITACSFDAIDKTPTKVTNESKPVGEFIDNWTFNVFSKTSFDFEEAKFRLWLPEDEENIRAILVLLSFHNGSTFGDMTLEEWQTYAKDEKLGLLGVTLRGGNYPDVSMGSGEALIKALDTITYKNNIPDIGKLPLLLKGYSAGGVFSYNFSHLKPERVIAFVNIRGGGINPTSNTNNNVPGLMLLGENDESSRNQRMTDVVLSKRAEGNLYGLAIEPDMDHFGGLFTSWRLTRAFFSAALDKRLTPETNTLNNIQENSGWLGNNTTKEIHAFDNYPNATIEASWLIDETFAEKWKAYQEN
ncbi:hypothetical protein [Pontimicrobium sp. SW4]|uniref:Alpha/beta hydrolase n=1 Tax=Pontimicrobium sp. SW4 TaxID=3153519 RepID=A0AAU7BR45_9FLAO